MKLLKPLEVLEMDLDAIKRFNSSPRRHPDHVLQTRTGAFLPTINIFTAPVVLLLSNPGYSEDLNETPDLCEQFQKDDWPFGHLHEEAPHGARTWTHQRLRYLVKEFGAHYVSRHMACAQLTPWASKRFHGHEGLPSRSYILDVVKKSAENGALLVVMRSKKLWSPALGSCQFILAKNPRCAYMSPGNIADYDKLLQALRSPEIKPNTRLIR